MLYSVVNIAIVVEIAVTALLLLGAAVRVIMTRHDFRVREQFLIAVTEKPGTTVAELAVNLCVDRSSLYPVASRLQADKEITRWGAGFAAGA
jgi:hypothetical protein